MKCVDRFLNWLVFGMLCLIGGSLFAQNNYDGLMMRNQRLIFNNQAVFDQVYGDLYNQIDTWYANPGVEVEPPGMECPDDNPILESFENELGFSSLRKTFLQQECEVLRSGGTPDDVPMHHLVDEVLAAMVSPEYTLQIGQDIYYLPPSGLIFTIRNANESSLQALQSGANPYLLNDVEIFENGFGCVADFNATGGGTETVGFSFIGQPSFGNLSYLWEFGDGNSSMLQNPVHTYPSFGDYEVCLTIEVPEPNACVDRICKTITVGVSCKPFFIYQETGQPGGICFVDNSVLNGNVVSWDWKFGDGNGSNQQNPCHVYPCDKTFLATLTVTTDENCTGTTTLPVFVDSYSCCSLWASESGQAYLNNENNRIKYWQAHIHLPFLYHRVVANMRHFKKNSKGKWRRARADLKIELYGQVYLKGASGCTCQTPFSIDNVKIGYNKKSILITKAVGKFFRAKQEDPWGARYTVNNTLVKDALTPVACD
jgi:PKD repeat protein